MKLSDIKRRHVTIGGIAAVLLAVPGLYAAAATLGFSLDRPAWHSELTVLAGSVEQLQKQTDQRELFRLEQREDRLTLRIEKDKAEGRRPSPQDVLERQQIRRQIESLRVIMNQ